MRRVVARFLASKAGQVECFVENAISTAEQGVDFLNSVAHRVDERAFNPGTQFVPVGFAIEDKVVHPSVAGGEHLDEKVFQLFPVVVAPQQQLFDGGTENAIARVADVRERLAGGAPIEFAGLAGDVEACAEAREQWLLQRQGAAERVDGGDAQLRGQVEQVPAESLRMGERGASEWGRMFATQFVEDAVAHFGGGGVCEGDSYNLGGVVDQRKQAEKALGE